MQVINMLFLKVVEMSLTAGIVIGVVLTVRVLFRRLPGGFAYVLWIAVAFRLIVPVSVNSDISIFNLFESGDKAMGMKQEMNRSGAMDGKTSDDVIEQANQEAYAQGSVPTPDAGTGSAVNSGSGAVRNDVAASFFEGFTGDVTEFGRRSGNLISIMAFGWVVGILILVSYTAAASIGFKRRIRYSIRLYDNIYACDRIRSPFVFGILAPKIYLPFRLSETEQRCILAHERYHILRRDYLVKNAAYVLAVVYWFHPLVWVAYRLMCIDMEVSCDEKVISGFTSEMRKEYSRLLLAFATNKRQSPVSPLAFGEEKTMKRVRNVLNYKKAAQWKLAVGVMAIMLTMAACVTDASTNETTVPGSEQVVGTNRNNHVNNEVIVSTMQGMNVTVHASERDSGNVHHTIEHHQAQWAENSMFDMEFYSLDFADADKIVFHISSGLFQYDLREQKITRSIDLKALECQEVQTGGECKVTVYQNSDNQLRAVIKPYPYSDGAGYVYDLESDDLFAYDALLVDDYVMFDGFASKYDSTVAESLRTWRAAENVLPLEENSYGALYWGPGPYLTNMCYEAGDQTWNIFHEEQATLPELQKQDDSFYQSFSLHSGESIGQCVVDYSGFYNNHDYAGVCALSTGLEYSDEMQQEFRERSDALLLSEEVSHSDDEKEYLIQFSYSDESGESGQKVYVNFKYLEGEGWRAEGLPTTQNDK